MAQKIVVHVTLTGSKAFCEHMASHHVTPVMAALQMHRTVEGPYAESIEQYDVIYERDYAEAGPY